MDLITGYSILNDRIYNVLIVLATISKVHKSLGLLKHWNRGFESRFVSGCEAL